MTRAIDFCNGNGEVCHNATASFEVAEVIANFHRAIGRQIPREVAFLNCKRTPSADAETLVKFVVGRIQNEVHQLFFVETYGEFSRPVVGIGPVGPSKGNFGGAHHRFALTQVDDCVARCTGSCCEYTRLRIDATDTCGALSFVQLPSETFGQSHGIAVGVATRCRKVDGGAADEQILIGQNLRTGKGVVVLGSCFRVSVCVALGGNEQNCVTDGTVCSVRPFDAVGVCRFAFVTRKRGGRTAAVQVDGVDATQIFHYRCHCVQVHTAGSALVTTFANVGYNRAVSFDAYCGTRMFFVPSAGITQNAVIDKSHVPPTAGGVFHLEVGVVHFHSAFRAGQSLATLVIEKCTDFVGFADDCLLVSFGIVHNAEKSVRIVTVGILHAVNHQAHCRGTVTGIERRTVDGSQNVPTVFAGYKVYLSLYG